MKPPWEKSLKPMTHTQAVNRMAKWLQFTKRFPIVVKELSTNAMEIPDVIAFHGGASMLIECKVSRSDFKADKDKRWRRIAAEGMGDHRYFAAPEGILKPEEIPGGWGLLEITERCINTLKLPEKQPKNARSELVFLTSVIRRLQLSTAVYALAEHIGSRLDEAPDGPAGTCYICGCTDKDCTRCVARTGEPCSWGNKAHTICSACLT